MNNLNTDGNLILITTFDKQTANSLDQLSEAHNPLILQYNTTRKYFFRISGATETSWTVPDRVMGSSYDGFFGFYGDITIAPPHESTNFKVVSGDLTQIPQLHKITIDLWITMFCDLVVQTYGNKQIKTIEKSPTAQLDIEYDEIIIPFLFTRWENEPITRDKIHALNLDNDELELTFGRVTYEDRRTLISSVMLRLFKLGYSETDIFNICDEYNFYNGPFSYRFARDFENMILYIIEHEITKITQNLYSVGFKYWNDHLVYSALLSLGLRNFTLSPSVTNMQLRRITGIVGHNSIVVSLKRLHDAGLITKELLKSSGDDFGYYQIWKYHISPEIDIEQYVGSFDGCSALLLNHQKLRHVKRVFITLTEELNAQKTIGKGYQIIQLLNDVSKMSPKEISAEIGIGYSLTRDYVKKLFDLGLLERTKKGRQNIYSLSENYYEILQSLMVAHLVKNTQKINAEIERYNVLLDSKKEFDDTRDKYVENGTLETKLRELGNNEVRK